MVQKNNPNPVFAHRQGENMPGALGHLPHPASTRPLIPKVAQLCQKVSEKEPNAPKMHPKIPKTNPKMELLAFTLLAKLKHCAAEVRNRTS